MEQQGTKTSGISSINAQSIFCGDVRDIVSITVGTTQKLHSKRNRIFLYTMALKHKNPGQLPL